MASYWAKLTCTGGSSGGVGTHSQMVTPGGTASFSGNFMVSPGSELKCSVTFESIGRVPFPKPGGGLEWKTDKQTVDLGGHKPKRGCECSDFKDSEGAPYASSCAAGSTSVNTSSKAYGKPPCSECKPCNYDEADSAWKPLRSAYCSDKQFTRTNKSFAMHGGGKFYLGCPSKTKQAFGTTPALFDTDAICAGTKVPMAPTNCIGDRREVTGTKQPDWSEWVEYGTGTTFDFSLLCEDVTKSMTRYDRNGCQPNGYQGIRGTIPTDDPRCCYCHKGWSRGMPTSCPPGQGIKSAPAPSFLGLRGCDVCYKCDECECAGGASGFPPDCPPGQTVISVVGAGGSQSCAVCYRCSGDDDDDDEGPSPAPCSEGVWSPSAACMEGGQPFIQTFYPAPGCSGMTSRLQNGTCSNGYWGTCYSSGTPGETDGEEWDCWHCNDPGC